VSRALAAAAALCGVQSEKRSRRPSSWMRADQCDVSWIRPFVRQVSRNGSFPKANIGLWKVAKIFHFLATFKVHPWIDVTIHERLPQRLD
jgi:hypothetical protein